MTRTPVTSPSRTHAQTGSDIQTLVQALDPEAALAALREELDRIDGLILETLHRRLDCCRRIGELKRDHAIPMMQPHRVGLVQARANAFALSRGINPDFVQALYRLIITETCRLEEAIIAGASP